MIYTSVSTTGWRWSFNTLATWCWRANSLAKTLMLGKPKTGGEGDDREVGWHHRLIGHDVKQALGGGKEQGRLACCSPWGRKESDTAERLNSNQCQFLILVQCNKLRNGVWDLQLSFNRSESLYFFMILEIRCQFLFKKKKGSCNFDREYVEFVDQFRGHCHLNNINYSNLWTRDIHGCHLLMP